MKRSRKREEARRERNRARARSNGAPLATPSEPAPGGPTGHIGTLEESLAIARAYSAACTQIEQEAMTDLIIASAIPDFEPAFARIFIEPAPPGALRFRCTPIYMQEAVGPTREVRIGQ